MLFKTKVSWLFVTAWYILGKTFRTLTGQKFKTLFLSFDCLTTGETESTLALSGKIPLEILFIIVSPNGLESAVAYNSSSLGGILSVPAAFLSSMFLSSFRISGLVTLSFRNFPIFWGLPSFFLILIMLGLSSNELVSET